MLRYHEGEAWRLRGRPGDRERAHASYAEAITLPNAPAEAWRAHGYALIAAGRRDEGRAALVRYLQLAPEAADAAMVRYSLQQ
jgi:Flp pilus assembly protein TadD